MNRHVRRPEWDHDARIAVGMYEFPSLGVSRALKADDRLFARAAHASTLIALNGSHLAPALVQRACHLLEKVSIVRRQYSAILIESHGRLPRHEARPDG